MPEILPGYGQHQARAGQVGRADDVAAVRGDLDPVPGHDRDDFQVRRVSRIIPAERAGIVTPSVASRCVSSAAGIGDRHMFTAHSTTMPPAPGNSAAHGLPERPDVIMSLIAILPVNSFRPFPMKIVGCRGFPGYAALEKCAQ